MAMKRAAYSAVGSFLAGAARISPTPTTLSSPILTRNLHVSLPLCFFFSK